MSPLCSIYNRTKCLLIRELFGQTENIFYSEQGINEACFLMDFHPTRDATQELCNLHPQ